jgi:acyl-CoA synthetase (AMP-forming)/AMP-acid ligase II
MESEGVTFAAGVPTVWQMLLGHVQAGGLKFSTLKRTVIGGSACPPAMIAAFQDQYGVEVLHAWGMTEMSPLGTVCTLKNKHLAMPADEQMKIRLKQGRAVFGVDMKIIDGDGKELPWDGKTYGDLLVKGPWIVGNYYKGSGDPLVKDERGRRLVPHGRRGHHRRRRLHADHRPQQGRDQVRRRVDQLDRHREHRDGPLRRPWARPSRSPGSTRSPA